MANVLLTPADDIVTIINGLNSGDKAILTAGQYNIAGNILKDGVIVYSRKGVVLNSTGDLFVGVVNIANIAGMAHVLQGVINIDSQNCLLTLAEANTEITLAGSYGINIETATRTINLSGSANVLISFMTGNINYIPGEDNLSSKFKIGTFKAGKLTISGNAHHTACEVKDMPTVVGEYLSFDKCAGTVIASNSVAGNSIRFNDRSEMDVVFKGKTPSLNIVDDASLIIVNGEATTTVETNKSIEVRRFISNTYDAPFESTDSAIEIHLDETVVLSNITESKSGLVSFNKFRPNYVRPRFEWDGSVHYKNDMATSGQYTSVALRETLDNPAPQVVGAEVNAYQGTLTPVSLSAKQLITGSRYTFPQDLSLNGYRVYTSIGSQYQIYLVTDPLGVAKITQGVSFTAEASGWQDFGLVPTLIAQGTVFDIVVRITEADPTPTTFSGNWNYTKPNNEGTPSSGQAQQANKALGLLKVHHTDDDGGNRQAELIALTIGDTIDAAGVSWTIQSVTDFANYTQFGVAPATQGGATGVQNFDFNTVSSVPIDYGWEQNYWLSNANVEGLFIADGDYSSIVPDDNQYGIDILFQDVIISDDWFIISYSGASVGAAGVGEGTTIHNELTGREVNDAHPISSITGLQSALDGKEPNLGNPSVNGYAVISQIDGTRSFAPLGASSHPDLTNRNDVDQHTIAAITNLQTTLDGKEPKNTNIQEHINNASLHFSTTERSSMDAANNPSATNALATMNDVNSVPGGDMTKAQYDVLNTGVVDDSERLGGQLPSFYNQSAHVSDITTNPHQVTKSQVGLGNVSNLAPADMPISDDTQSALDGKEPANANIQNHISQTNIHFVINDSSTATNIAWSGSRINSQLALKVNTTTYNSHVSSNVHLSSDERAAIDNTPSAPSALNPFATQDDLAQGGFGDMLKSVYDQDGSSVVDDSERLGGELPAVYDQSAHLLRVDNPHSVTAAQVGAEPANANIQSHIAQTNIHFVINDLSTSLTVAWSANKISGELSGKVDNIDLTNHINDEANPHSVTKAQVGLSEADNTSDADKPLSDDMIAALNTKEPTISPKNSAFNKNFGTTSTTVAYGNHTHSQYEPIFDKNTGFNKNFGTVAGTVSQGNHTHTQYEPVFTKNTAFNKNFGTTSGTVATGNHTHDYSGIYEPANANIQAHISNITTNPHQVDKGDVGLGNVSNIAPADLPISDDTQIALDGKEDAFTKNTAFNKNWGTTSTTTSRGNHLHTGVYEPANANIQAHISNGSIHVTDDEADALRDGVNFPDANNLLITVDDLTPLLAGKEDAFNKNTAFNKNFGTVAGTVAEGNHTHPAQDVDTNSPYIEYKTGDITALANTNYILAGDVTVFPDSTIMPDGGYTDYLYQTGTITWMWGTSGHSAPTMPPMIAGHLYRLINNVTEWVMIDVTEPTVTVYNSVVGGAGNLAQLSDMSFLLGRQAMKITLIANIKFATSSAPTEDIRARFRLYTGANYYRDILAIPTGVVNGSTWTVQVVYYSPSGFNPSILSVQTKTMNSTANIDVESLNMTVECVLM